MATLTVWPKGTDFDAVKVAADVAGDEYRQDQLTELWLQNWHGTDTLTVTIPERLPCNHGHHGLVNVTYTVEPGAFWRLGPEDVRWMADSSRMIQAQYSFVATGGGQSVVFVAAIRGY